MTSLTTSSTCAARAGWPVAGIAALLAVLATGPCHAGRFVEPGEFRLHVGDLPDCGSPDLDDSNWPRIAFHDVPLTAAPICLRTTVNLTAPADREGVPLALGLGALAASEVWWDGAFIGRSGTVGIDAADETPGPIDSLHPIPERLSGSGPHTLAVRASAFHRHFDPGTGYWYVFVADYDSVVYFAGRATRTALIALSGIVMAGLLSLMLYAVDRKDRSFLFLALLCLTAAALAIAESWRSLVGYTYDWHLLRLLVVTSLALLLDLLLLVFLARRFPMSRSRWFVGSGVVLAMIPVIFQRSWDPKVLVGFFWVFLLSLAWSLRAMLQRRTGGLLAFLGLVPAVVLLLWNRGSFIEGQLYIALDILLLFLFGSHVIQVRRVRREREEARIKSSRLELELLRRHIQPHFLMNTLTALSEWIEQEPRVAAQMIQSLSEEFRLLSDIADRQVIPIEEEIRLCLCHLEIMSHRKGRRFAMATDGVDPTAAIPPAVFHTLVENAITHNHYRDAKIEFRLSARRDGDRTRYVFEAPLGEESSQEPRTTEGTGLRYVRSRLEEAFGQRWSLSSGATGRRWRTEIVVPTGT